MSFSKILESMYISFSDDEMIVVNEKMEEFIENNSLLSNIDTSSVDAMHYPFTQGNNDLRSDDVHGILAVEDVIKNADQSKDNMVKIVKVLADE